MLMSYPQRFNLRAWDEDVAREVRHQARIEEAFDRFDEFERLGCTAQALDWLDAAEELAGGLPPLYRAKRARFARKLARHLRPVGPA
jgi:hypothetical protein